MLFKNLFFCLDIKLYFIEILVRKKKKTEKENCSIVKKNIINSMST